MSRGAFDYQQYRIKDIADTIEEHLDAQAELPAGDQFNPETVAELRKTVRLLRLAFVYAYRADWLLSGDDGEESFHRRLAEELKGLDA